MSNRRFEMFEIRTVLVRLRRGDSHRAIARASLMGRNKLRRFRALADRHGWLDPATPLPDHDEFCREAESGAPGDSSVEPYRAQVESWARQRVKATTIHQTLVRNHSTTAAIPRSTDSSAVSRPPRPPSTSHSHPAKPPRWTSAPARDRGPRHRRTVQDLVLPDDAGVLPAPIR